MTYNIKTLADIETRYLKLDKKIPTDFRKNLMCTLLDRYSNLHRFNANIIEKNDRFLNVLNPVCSDITYTPYEQALYGLCNKFKIDVSYTIKDIRKDCFVDITYDIQQKNLSCDLLSGLSITQKIIRECDYNLLTSISEEKCKNYYNELVQQKSCSYSYGQYKNLLSLGFLPQTITDAAENNVYISPDGKYLTTTTTTYSLDNELCFSGVSFEGIKNQEEFLDKIITDLPEDLKSKIINSI